MGVSLSTVKRDLEAVRLMWVESAAKELALHKAEQLAKLDMLESEAWAAWRRSCEKAVNGDSGETPEANPRYMALVFQCIDRRCKLLRLDTNLGDFLPERFLMAGGISHSDSMAAVRDELAALDDSEALSD